jgi:hypothetical protein
MTEQPMSGADVSKFIAGAQDWLRTQVPHLAPVDGQGQTCPCPLCKVVATVRDVDPDMAATWLSTALATFTSTLATYTENSTTSDPGWVATQTPAPTTVDDDGGQL